MAGNKYPEITVNRILDAATELFITKGYESTTIQDIINALGDLSKGAIYHHFRSKEEIINAVVARINKDTEAMFAEIQSMTELNGLEKLKKYLEFSVSSPNQEVVMKAIPNLLKNPKFLVIQLESSVGELAKRFLGKMIHEGVADGSIVTDFPDELAQVLGLLFNIWLNPMVLSCTEEEFIAKCKFLQQLTKNQGLDMIDDNLVSKIDNLGSMVINHKR